MIYLLALSWIASYVYCTKSDDTDLFVVLSVVHAFFLGFLFRL